MMIFDYEKDTLSESNKKYIINILRNKLNDCKRLEYQFVSQFEVLKNSQANDELTKLAFAAIERNVKEARENYTKLTNKIFALDESMNESQFYVHARSIRSDNDYAFKVINTFSGNLNTIAKQLNNPIFTLACEEVSNSLGDWIRGSYQISYCCPSR